MKNMVLTLVIMTIVVSCGLGAFATMFNDPGADSRQSVKMETAMEQPVITSATLSLSTVLYGLRAAIMDKPMTFMMTDGRQIMMAWYDTGKWFFTGFYADTGLVIEQIEGALPNMATCLDCTNMGAFVDFLKKNGWQTITSEQVPNMIKLSILAQSASTVVTMATGKLTTFIVFVFTPTMIPNIQTPVES